MNNTLKEEFNYFKSILKHLLDWKFWLAITVAILIGFGMVAVMGTIIKIII